MKRLFRRLPAARGMVLAGALPGAALGSAVLLHLASPEPVPVAAALVPAPAEEPRTLARAPLTGAVRAVRAEVERGAFPGAALAAGRGAKVELFEGVGTTTWRGGRVDAERTVYDLASLTKVVATTTAAMLLYEDGLLELDAPVGDYLPAYGTGKKSAVTVRHLLTHTSGLPAGAEVRGRDREERISSLVRAPLRRDPGSGVVYSDVGFVVLGELLERAAGEPLPSLLERRVYHPLGMRSTRFSPGKGCETCAPTGLSRSGEPLRGVVHDPTAKALGGVAGNAGLFSTAADLSRFAAMLAGGGELEGTRVLKEETLRTFAEPQPDAPGRALGWEVPKGSAGPVGRTMSSRAFGHTGFTGTSLWVDPERGTWAVLLTNRTYDAHASSRMQSLRRRVHALVTESADAQAGEEGMLAE